MLRTFIRTTRTPERADLLIRTLVLIENMGYLNLIDSIETIGGAEAETNPDLIIAAIEDQIGEAVTAIYAAHSINIDYDPNKLQEILDLLRFLLFFNQPGGYTATHLQTQFDLYELGETNEEILLNLYESSGHCHSNEPIDWITRVGIAFINNLAKAVEQAAQMVPEEEPGEVIQGETLEVLKKFSALHPESIAVKHINQVQGRVCNINNLFFIYDDILNGMQPNALAVELVGFSIISATPSDKTKGEFAIDMVETAAGQNTRALNVINAITQVIAKVGMK